MKFQIPVIVLGMAIALGGCSSNGVNSEGVNRSRATQADGSRDNSTMAARRGSEIIGMDIYSNDGKKAGTVKDIVTDQNNETVQYVVIGTGGALGVGEKLHAMPWQKLQFRSVDPGQIYVDMNELQITNSPTFENGQWPDLSNGVERAGIYNYYNVEDDRRTDRKRENRSVTRINNEGPVKMGLLWCRRVSALIGANVRSKTNEDLGEIKDVVINTNSGEVHYAVLGFGGTMGMGDKLFAVPVSSMHTEAASQTFVLNTSKESLKNAPGFDKNTWPNFADPGFKSKIDSFYLPGPQARTSEY